MDACDVAVVGAGAAGLMTAIAAARAPEGRRVVLLDSRRKVGAKILVSGGTRCNVTNVRVRPEDYQGGPRHFVKHVLESFNPDRTRAFFSELGVELVLEPTGKYFPVTHSGKTVLEALLKEVNRLHVPLEFGAKILDVRKKDGVFVLSGKAEDGTAYSLRAGRVVLATGGLSLPETGSDGTGLAIAERLGHTIVRTAPSLTPLSSTDAWTGLSGVTLEAKLFFYSAGKKRAEAEGSFLFTHTGYSGPAALDISRHYALADRSEKPEIFASFLPSLTEEKLKKLFEEARSSNPLKLTRNFFADDLGLPARVVEMIFRKSRLDGEAVLRRFPMKDSGRLFQGVLHAPLGVNGVVGYKKAEVTAGGVDLAEVRVATMESKKIPGLYFAGEILDIDGRIGGFNFQWAWSTGALAGSSAVKAER